MGIIIRLGHLIAGISSEVACGQLLEHFYHLFVYTRLESGLMRRSKTDGQSLASLFPLKD